jgi:hypothetical protein
MHTPRIALVLVLLAPVAGLLLSVTAVGSDLITGRALVTAAAAPSAGDRWTFTARAEG